MKHIKPLLFVTTLFFFMFIPAERVFSREVFTSGLKAPIKIITAGQYHLIVAETGTAAPNSGRISLVNRINGARRTLLDKLPSALNPVENAPSGPSGLKLVGLQLYVTIGQGDSVKPGGRGGLVVNPNPVTPLNNSVLELTLPADYEEMSSGLTLTISDQILLSKGAQVLLQSGEGRTMNMRMVANLPDYKVENRPGLPQGNVRPANLFGVEMVNGRLYVVDASFNELYLVLPLTGEYFTFAAFPSRPNPLPFGPPFVEAVPTSVRAYIGSLLVTCFTGFPFARELSDIRQLNFDGSENTVFMDELTSVIDVLPVIMHGTESAFYILQFSTNMVLQPMPPGTLKLVTPDRRRTVSETLISPTSMARDSETGTIYVTEIFPGNIVRIVPDLVNPEFDPA